ncbi:hypothetical protein OS175_00315 [Marinicella sp. S1101]|uniref:hypothetical protein n=1 Tax=Marinicella marina TaxID=2996016 RepID=UPI00226095A0|nr:hypothetical protein [Marinicella marina]MCX7552305.1 hypothetical protein [Marinicella marina]MDJ1139180.1 hypothetical protein [Marinicella marina]
MKKISAVLLLMVSCALMAQTTKVLIVGDSWAEQQWNDGIHNVVFADSNYPEFTALGDVVAISGSTAADWVVPSELQKITDALTANPSIDTVQLTLGGNDFLAQWNVALTPMAVTAIQNQIIIDLQIVVDHILAQDINMEIVLSFYDYPNFEDTTGGFTGIICANLHNDLGNPTPLELNTIAVSFEQAFASSATTNPKVFQVSHSGLMQNYFGFPDANPVIPPGQIQPPGDLSLPSPVQSMRLNAGVVVDCFHLGAEGYDVLVQNTFDQYFRYRFDTLFKSLFE